MSDNSNSDDNSGSDKNKKVVPFPAHRVKKTKIESDSVNEQASSLNRRVTLVLSLLSTVMIATFLASQMNQGTDNLKQTADRVLASVSETGDLQDEILLAKKIARDSLRQPASRGHEPTPEDILRHGADLASLYALRFNDDGGLVELKYHGPVGKKRELKDRIKFIKENMDIFKIPFDYVVLEPASDMAGGDMVERFEVYSLIQGDRTKAKVHFILDQQSKISQMNVELL